MGQGYAEFVVLAGNSGIIIGQLTINHEALHRRTRTHAHNRYYMSTIVDRLDRHHLYIYFYNTYEPMLHNAAHY